MNSLICSEEDCLLRLFLVKSGSVVFNARCFRLSSLFQAFLWLISWACVGLCSVWGCFVNTYALVSFCIVVRPAKRRVRSILGLVVYVLGTARRGLLSSSDDLYSQLFLIFPVTIVIFS